MRLDHRHVTAISALAQGCTQQQAAAEASVTSRTIRRWLDDPAFSEAVQRVEGETLQRITRRLVAMTDAGLTRLDEVVTDGETPPASFLRAMKILIDAALKYKELQDIEARLTALEGAINHE